MPSFVYFKIVYHNTRSLNKHFADLKSFDLLSGAHLIAVAESRLLPSDSDADFSLPGYSILRNDQAPSSHIRPSHGSLVYCHDLLQLSDFHTFSSDTCEYILLHLPFRAMPLQIVFVYISPSCPANSFQAFVEDIHHHLNSTLPFVLMGDTNLDIHSPQNTSKIKFLENTLHCKQLMMLPTTDNNSVLDHIYSNMGNIPAGILDSYWSDHKFIYTFFN